MQKKYIDDMQFFPLIKSIVEGFILKQRVRTLKTLLLQHSPLFCDALQHHTSPNDWARDLFTSSTDSASFVVWIKQNFFRFEWGLSVGDVTMEGCFQLRLPGRGRNPTEPFFGSSFVLESRPAWSKHWHVGCMRPANAFCMPYVTQSHKYIIL